MRSLLVAGWFYIRVLIFYILYHVLRILSSVKLAKTFWKWVCQPTRRENAQILIFFHGSHSLEENRNENDNRRMWQKVHSFLYHERWHQFLKKSGNEPFPICPPMWQKWILFVAHKIREDWKVSPWAHFYISATCHPDACWRKLKMRFNSNPPIAKGRIGERKNEKSYRQEKWFEDYPETIPV